MNDEMVEKIAKAIYGAIDRETPWGEVVELWPTTYAEYLTRARACLSAIESSGMVIVPREPTRERLHCLIDGEARPWGGESQEFWGSADEMLENYKAFLAAALAEK